MQIVEVRQAVGAIYPQNALAPGTPTELKSWTLIENSPLYATDACRAAFIKSPISRLNSELGIQITAELQCLKKRKQVHQPGRKKYIFLKNALLFTKVPIRPTKTRSSLCIYLWLFFSSSLYLFIYLNVHTFRAEHCCSISPYLFFWPSVLFGGEVACVNRGAPK